MKRNGINSFLDSQGSEQVTETEIERWLNSDQVVPNLIKFVMNACYNLVEDEFFPLPKLVRHQ